MLLKKNNSSIFKIVNVQNKTSYIYIVPSNITLKILKINR